MKKVFFVISMLLGSAVVFCQQTIPFSYDGSFVINHKPLILSTVKLTLEILHGQENKETIYSESHLIKTDSFGYYHIDIGTGKQLSGNFDSIIWSDGVFYLRLTASHPAIAKNSFVKEILLRIPPNLEHDYEQGTVTATDHPDYGDWKLNHNRNQRPVLVTIDLSTSYANLAYPANTYPIYRHYEWSDLDRDGIGNSFCLTYSENTHHAFWENTKKLGDVKLYAKPFQELFVSSEKNTLTVSISKPEPQTNHSETYAIKGPWKFIYYIEW